MPRLRIDGLAVSCPAGTSLLTAAVGAGIDIPALCHDPRLNPAGHCRLCVVEIDGAARPAAACTTPAADGAVVRTDTTEIRDLRKGLLEMLVAHYPADAPGRAPDLRFHRLLTEYGVRPTATAQSSRVDDSHPAIRVDLNTCISCWRCVRICDEVQGQFTWRIAGRGADSRIVPDSGDTLAASSCVSCGACVDTCPTGALSDTSVLTLGRPTEWTRTTCPYCAVGCEMTVGTREGRITDIRPVLDAPVNRGQLCAKGRYGFGFTAAPDRITTPLLRGADGQWRAAGWDEAISVAVTGMRTLIDRGGPASVGVLGSARATNEENYLAQKFARVVLGTNNIDCCARVCHGPSAAGLAAVFGTGAATNSFDDIDLARTIVVCGSNTTEAHPVVGARIKQAALRGAGLIVIDPRRIELARFADIHLRPHPGTNVAVLNSIAAAIVDENMVDTGFLARRVSGFDDFGSFIGAYTPERAAAITGLDPVDVRRAARRYARHGPSMLFHGLGITEHVQGTDAVMCLANLALLTGNVGTPGAGCNPLRGQNNVQGAAVMGCEPHHLTGSAPIAESAAPTAAVWGAPVPEARGLDAMEMLDAAAAGAVHGLWVIGWDILQTQPRTPSVADALAGLDVLVVQDLFLNETARRYGTVFLPAAAAFEKDGTFMNSERRVQRVRAALAPPGLAKTDTDILCLAAAAGGRRASFTYRDAEDVWDEVRRVWPAGAGMSYARLQQPGGLQWPCPDLDHPGTALLHQHSFPGIGQRAALRSVRFRPSAELADTAFPFVLITGRELFAFNSGTMNSRSTTAALTGVTALDISPDDAATIGVGEGDAVRVASRHGEMVLPCHLSDSMLAGTVFATFSSPDIPVNTVVGPGRDHVTHTPEYKVTAVNLQPAVDNCGVKAPTAPAGRPPSR